MTGVVAGSRPNGNATELPLTPVCPAPPPVPAELPAVSSEVSTVFAPPVAVASLSARRSEATPFGSNPVAPPADSPVATLPERGVSIEAFGSVSSRTSLASPQCWPRTASTFARPTE